jgi:uncharacterized protein YndB with AHSA1/START domain
VDPAMMALWIGHSHELDARPGGMLRLGMSEGMVALGRFTEVVPYRRVAFTWGWEGPDPRLTALKPGSSLVEIDLEPTSGGTLLRLRHSGLPEGMSSLHGERWSHYLARFRAAARSLQNNQP